MRIASNLCIRKSPETEWFRACSIIWRFFATPESVWHFHRVWHSFGDVAARFYRIEPHVKHCSPAPSGVHNPEIGSRPDMGETPGMHIADPHIEWAR